MVTTTHFAVAAISLTALALTSLPLATAGRNCMGPNAPPAPQEWKWTDYPNPNSPNQRSQFLCCRSNQSYVCDPNGLISETQADEIDLAIKNVYEDTRCTCNHCLINKHGYIVRVAIMEKMVPVRNNDTSMMARLRDAHLYAYQISRRWHMEGACKESLLILYSRADNILFTLTLKEARKKVTDSKVGDVSLRVRDYFTRESTIADGIKEMIARYKLILMRDIPTNLNG